MKKFELLIVCIGLMISCKQEPKKDQGGFPFVLPQEKPNREMSAAMERIYTDYEGPQPQDNELFSQF